jgi:hypothetical protein
VDGTMAKDTPQHWKEFEEEGEESVRKKFNQGLYGHPGSARFNSAAGFLKQKDQKKKASREDQAIQREEARDAFARKLGLAALIVSSISIVISLLAFLK